MLIPGTKSHTLLETLKVCGKVSYKQLGELTGTTALRAAKLTTYLRMYHGVVTKTTGGGLGSADKNRYVELIEVRKIDMQDWFNKAYNWPAPVPTVEKRPSEGVRISSGEYADRMPMRFRRYSNETRTFRKLMLHNVEHLKLNQFIRDHVNCPHGHGGNHPNSLQALSVNGKRFLPKRLQ